MNKEIGRDTGNRVKIGAVLGKYGVYIALLVLFVSLSIASSSFLTVTNIFNILKQNSVYGILAVGMTFVIVTGGIDLSVGAIVAMSACFAASLAQDGTTTPIFVAILVGVLIGMGCGAFSGFFIAFANIPAFIATLATCTIARGIVYVFTDGRPVTGVSAAYKYIGRASWGPVPVAVVLYAAFLIAGTFLLKYTKYGRHVFAIGGNKQAATVSGIHVKRVEFLVYMISGFCAAFAGLLLSSRIQTGQPAGGDGYELDAITAAVIGGASLSGGKGSVFGSFIGILVVGILTNGLDLLNVSSYYQQIIKGAIILLAVLADRKKE
ncbi:MAG: ABC transporter permease [Lachnospiraceae bacterium]|jgi:ribose/xylose/arabinose/galactoside ABC-type transport system permease subunit|nr:ABC transporter permease [Lachnospiraceae bacterium]MCI9477416.1 ABC transporter permease [Lachnospiraceae bacterium]GFI08688.1 ribose import permease protein RbsC [Lachnospiraceae bacterium]